MRRRKKNFRPIKIDDADPANIVVYSDDEEHTESPEMMQHLKLTHPFGWLLIGMTGSGKSMLALNILDNPKMYKNFFKVIYLFSRTSKADKTFDRLKIKQENTFGGDDKSMIKALSKIIKKHTKEVESKGKKNADTVMIIIEDATSLKKFMRSAPFAEAFVQSRHFNGSVMVNAHKYSAVDRIARLNAHFISIFKTGNSEMDVVAEEYSPSNKKEFVAIMREAFKPDSRNKKPFFQINRKSADYPYRKTLDQGFDYR